MFVYIIAVDSACVVTTVAASVIAIATSYLIVVAACIIVLSYDYYWRWKCDYCTLAVCMTTTIAMYVHVLLLLSFLLHMKSLLSGNGLHDYAQ